MEIKKLINVKLFIILFFIGIISCVKENKKSKDIILENSLSKFKTLKLDSKFMKIKRVDATVGLYEDVDYYSYDGVNKNRNVYTRFNIYVNKKNDIYAFKSYTKTALDSINFNYLEKTNDIDTLYYFQISRFVPQHKLFILGKYNFYDKFGLFNKKQSLLYKKHKDSLSKVRGNVKLFEGMFE